MGKKYRFLCVLHGCSILIVVFHFSYLNLSINFYISLKLHLFFQKSSFLFCFSTFLFISSQVTELSQLLWFLYSQDTIYYLIIPGKKTLLLLSFYLSHNFEVLDTFFEAAVENFHFLQTTISLKTLKNKWSSLKNTKWQKNIVLWIISAFFEIG